MSSSDSSSSSSFYSLTSVILTTSSPPNFSTFSSFAISKEKEDQDNENEDYKQEPLSPELCRYVLLGRLEDLINKLSSGWKYHVANTEGVKQAWSRFEHFYIDLCSYTEGWQSKVLRELHYYYFFHSLFHFPELI